MQFGMLSWVGSRNITWGCRCPHKKGHFCVSGLLKSIGFSGLGKRVSCPKNWWTDFDVLFYMSHDMFLCKGCLLGVAMIAPVLKFLVALISLLLLVLHPFNGLFPRTTWVSRHQKGKLFWILLEQEMMLVRACPHALASIYGSGTSWTICKSFAPRSRQIITPVPHHSVFTG